MSISVEQTAHYCNRYAVFCTGANKRGECNTTACWNIQLLIDRWPYGGIKDELELLSSAGRPQGKWVKSHFKEYCGTDENHDAVFRDVPCVKCDQCGEKHRSAEKYCPNCGAKMEVKNEKTK